MNETALKDRLKTIAKEKGITFNECWKQLLLERLLARVSKSDHADKLIFKGGFFLSYSLEIGRETIDLDFLISRMRTERSVIQTTLTEIAALDLLDGFSFRWRALEELAQPHMTYPGFRVTLDAALGKMKDVIQIDLGTGDAVEPENRAIKLFEYRGKPIFEGEITLLTYSLETVFAEKLETLISRAAANSRMKDYHDLIILCRSGELRTEKLAKAVAATFTKRRTNLSFPLRFDPSGIEGLQRLWSAHMRGLGEIAHDLALPNSVPDLLDELNKFIAKAKLRIVG